MTGAIEITTAVRACVTDLGRADHAHLGIPVNGAADPYAAQAANILAGNPDDAPLIEVTATGFGFRARTKLLIAVTGAATDLHLDGAPAWCHQPVLVWPGQEVVVGAPHTGLHSYLAVHGTIRAPRLFGSTAPDPLLGFGTWLHGGDTVHIDGHTVRDPPYLPLFKLNPDPQPYRHDWVLDALPGPEANEFPDLTDTLTRTTFEVSPHSDDIGTRLTGTVPHRSTHTEILSRGVPLGAVEIPPTGGLIVLQRGRPVTAGYPVAAVVARHHHGTMAQLRPGDTVRLRMITRTAALTALGERHQQLDHLRRRAHIAFAASNTFTAPRA